MSDQFEMKDQLSMKTAQNETTIEQDFQELDDISATIAELIKRRYIVTDRISIKHNKNHDRLRHNNDWFAGDIQGRPVESVGAEVGYDEPTPRRY